MAAEADPRWEQLRAAFSVELDERVRELNRLLLQLERDDASVPRSETFDMLFREAHSLKGAARAVEVESVERLAHALESALEAARDAEAPPAPEWFDAAYHAVDALTPLYQAATGPQGGDGVDPAGTLHALAGAASSRTQPTPPLSPHPSLGRVPAPSQAATATDASPTPHVEVPPAPPADGAAMPAVPAGTLVQRVQDVTVGRGGVESVRVAVDKLDALLAAAGELAVAHLRVQQRLLELRELSQHLEGWRRERRNARGLRTRLRRAFADGADGRGGPSPDLEALLRFDERAEEHARGVSDWLDGVTARLRDDTAQLGFVARTIENEVLAVRLLPIGALFGVFERLVRDLTRQQGKEARLVLEGGDTELDRRILEQVRDPLMHMLRNAVDHGLEPPTERQAQGKPAMGTIRLAVTQRGGSVEIELADDGRGLDSLRLRQTAVRRGLLTAEQAAGLDDATARDLIFRPGFSTSESVTETSGRGVGMDVVRVQVERMHGQVAVDSAPGAGTRITVTVPLTLATTRALLVDLDGQRFAVPSAPVERTLRVRQDQLVWLEGRLAMAIQGHAVPVVELADVLERPRAAERGRAPDAWRPVLVLAQGERRLALLVDGLVGEQEIVVKSLGWPLRRVRNVGGAAVLGSGETILILNPTDLLKSGLRRGLLTPGAMATAADRVAPTRRRARVLVVDDSLTTRTLERSILEAAGYDVSVAADGVEALTVLRADPVDLVISDVDMPRLDGFGLTAEIRRDAALRQLPVVLVTSLAAPEHRERGVAVGADAYIVKSSFDQAQLLDTIGRLL